MSAGLSIAALVIALAGAGGTIYAVAIGREALAWQKEQDIARVTPSVRIEIEHAADAAPGPLLTALDLQDPRPWPLEYRLTTGVINTGETTEHLKRLRIEAADHSEGHDLKPVGKDAEIQPGARYTAIVPLAEVPKWESGFIAIATLARGDEFASAVEYADDDLLVHIEGHNRGAKP